jgi:hypothetical protein
MSAAVICTTVTDLIASGEFDGALAGSTRMRSSPLSSDDSVAGSVGRLPGDAQHPYSFGWCKRSELTKPRLADRLCITIAKPSNDAAIQRSELRRDVAGIRTGSRATVHHAH